MTIRLIVGQGQAERIIDEADALLLAYRQEGDIGYEYIKHQPLTPPDKLLPEDLAVTLLVNSRAGYRAFQSIRDNGANLDLASLPDKPLADIDDAELKVVVNLISQVASWRGFAASLATKVLHKKRPQLIPILDNQAIFGAYMSREWPEKLASADSIKDAHQIENALRAIQYDIRRPENQGAWPALQSLEPGHSLIEIFDSVWWTYFRSKEPVKRGRS